MQNYQYLKANWTFDDAAFNALLKGRCNCITKTMRAISQNLHVSYESIKEWRRGAHAPSDIRKVTDLAKFFDVKPTILLKKTELKMENKKLNPLQQHAFLQVYDRICNFNFLAEACQEFVWKEYDIRSLNPSLIKDIVPSAYSGVLGQPGPDGLIYGEYTLLADDLHEQLVQAAWKSLEKARPFLSGTGAYEDLGAHIEEYLSKYGYDENDKWIPDPDLLFDPPEGALGQPRPATHMEKKAAAGAKNLERLVHTYLRL